MSRPVEPLRNAPPPTRMYRLAVLGWPTPDNAPFTQTDERALDDLFDWVMHDAERPDWLPAEYQKSWFPAFQHFELHEGDHWPGFSRFNYVSQSGATARARVMRNWGVTVHVIPSKPITWPDDTR